MIAAHHALPPPSGDVPVSFLVDFDGTIATTDVSEMLLVRHATDPGWRTLDALYDAGRAGSRDLLAWDVTVLPHDATLLTATAADQPMDAGFRGFVSAIARHRASLEVVSDGLGFYVAPALDRLGLPEVPVATAELDLGATPPRIAFPYGHPDCLVCGTCKRERVRLHQAGGHLVVFVGDGTSDRYGAGYADLVFAKERLVDVCRAEGWPYRTWSNFAELARWVDRAFTEGELPSRPDEVAGWREQQGVAARPFFCGPEVWGEGRHSPPEDQAGLV